MKKVTLQFPNAKDLRNFITIANCRLIEVNFSSFCLVTLCDDAEIELAERVYHATIINIEATPS